ncbi:MAG TPA: 30S ribosomal protein S20 [Nevskiaceae bacterium]|nr:30S ribosomal protein S20 [Nevskiaceae bacterium]
MPITTSAKKALRQDRRRAVINKKIKRKIKKALKKARQKPTKKTLAEAARVLDRAAKKKLIHKNKAARLKSRLVKLLKTKK